MNIQHTPWVEADARDGQGRVYRLMESKTTVTDDEGAVVVEHIASIQVGMYEDARSYDRERDLSVKRAIERTIAGPHK